MVSLKNLCVCLCCMCGCKRVKEDAGACMLAHVKVIGQHMCLSPLLSSQFLSQGLSLSLRLVNLARQQVGKLRDPAVSAFPTPGSQAHTAMPGFYVAAGEPAGSGLSARVASPLLPEPSSVHLSVLYSPLSSCTDMRSCDSQLARGGEVDDTGLVMWC